MSPTQFILVEASACERWASARRIHVSPLVLFSGSLLRDFLLQSAEGRKLANFNGSAVAVAAPAKIGAGATQEVFPEGGVFKTFLVG